MVKLMKALIYGLWITILGWFGYSHPHAPLIRHHGYEINHQAIEKAKNFTVMISNDGFGPQWRGTGVIIGDKYILTCNHVADNSVDEGLNDLNVFFYPGYLVAKGKVVYQDYWKDLAILEIDQSAKGMWTRPVFTTENYDGEPITILGNAEGAQKWFVGYGMISGRTPRDLLTDGTVMPGDSGGPWIDYNGKIVALSDWGLPSEDAGQSRVNGGISSKTIQEFVKDWRAGQKSRTLPKVEVVGVE